MLYQLSYARKSCNLKCLHQNTGSCLRRANYYNLHYMIHDATPQTSLFGQKKRFGHMTFSSKS
jgi:hypothetical protein